MSSTTVRRGFAFVLCAAATPAFARDLNVPAQYASISDALHAASPGDHVFVRGGRHVDPNVYASDVTVTGIGATLTGTVRVAGSRLTLEGFRIADGTQVFVYGADVAVSRNRARGRGRWNLFAWGGMRITIADNVAPAGAFQAGGAYPNYDWLVGTDDTAIDVAQVVMRGNRCKSIEVHADRSTIAGNRTSAGVTMEGDDADVHGNAVRAGIVARGDRVVLKSNNVFRRGAAGISVKGGSPTIEDNVVRVVPLDLSYASCPGMIESGPAIVVEGRGTGGGVARNTVTHTLDGGFDLRMDGAEICDNVARGVASANSMTVTGSGNTVERNEVSQSVPAFGDAIGVYGGANVIRANVVTSAGVYGIVVGSGPDNVVKENDVARAPGGGIFVAGDAVGTVVSECTLTRCGPGLLDYGTNTTIDKSMVVRGR